MKFKKLKYKKVKSTNDTAIRIIKNSNLKFAMILGTIVKNKVTEVGDPS